MTGLFAVFRTVSVGVYVAGAGPPEDLYFHRQETLLAAQPDPRGTLIAAQALFVPLVGSAWSIQRRRTGLTDSHRFRDLGDRLLAWPDQLNISAPELHRRSSRHSAPLRDGHRHRVGVRETASTAPTATPRPTMPTTRHQNRPPGSTTRSARIGTFDKPSFSSRTSTSAHCQPRHGQIPGRPRLVPALLPRADGGVRRKSMSAAT
jgi:hypothetical protein